jgi:hypothetical protein
MAVGSNGDPRPRRGLTVLPTLLALDDEVIE